jgi:hypothetical protein
MMSRSCRLSLLVLVLFATGSCDLVDPMRSTPHADTETFGNLIESTADPSRPDAWVVKLRVGVPRALGRTDGAEPTPDVAGGILAMITVTTDTVVTIEDGPGVLADIGPGTEVVAIPVPGTTSMVGEKEIHLEASQLMDFTTYARWRLPKLTMGGELADTIEDPLRINSSGVESGPLPVGDGRVLYFSARLRPPELPGGGWIGARREGLATPTEGEASFDRSFRTELGDNGWSAPEPVSIPGTETASHVKLTWVSPDERRCYVTVSSTGGSPWVGIAERESPSDPWGEISPMEATGEGDAFDAVAMVGSPEKTVFSTTRNGGGDLFLHDPAAGPAQQLQPEINTGGLEWGPRVGPSDELYFVRGDRQLRFRDGRVNEVRLPGPHRRVLIEAAPTADGRWLFFAIPNLRPVDLDLDIYVAPITPDGSPGEPVPVDEWRPE